MAYEPFDEQRHQRELQETARRHANELLRNSEILATTAITIMTELQRAAEILDEDLPRKVGFASANQPSTNQGALRELQDIFTRLYQGKNAWDCWGNTVQTMLGSGAGFQLAAAGQLDTFVNHLTTAQATLSGAALGTLSAVKLVEHIEKTKASIGHKDLDSSLQLLHNITSAITNVTSGIPETLAFVASNRNQWT